jgi:hypothetical protein
VGFGSNSFGKPKKPPKGKAKAKAEGRGRKERLKPEDVAEDKPELAKFLEKRRQAEKSGKDRGELSFYVCLVFQSNQQKWDFLDAIGKMKDLEGKAVQVPVLYGMYADGEELSKLLGIPVTPCPFKPLNYPIRRELAEMVLADQEYDARLKHLNKKSVGFG